MRTREYLTPSEVAKLLKVAGQRSRYGQRDACLILLAYRHGLRVSELVSLRWDQVDLKAGHVHVRRAKNGTPSTHPMQGDELRALRQLAREWPDHGGFVFVSERGGPMSADGVRKLITRTGEEAKLSFPVHTLTCFGMRAASSWPMTDMTRAHCNCGWVTRTFSTRSDTRN